MTIKGPLSGKRVILLRTVEQSQLLKEELQHLGAEVLVYPMIEILPNETVLQKIDENFLYPFKTIIFTSANGVNVFFQYAEKNHIPIKNILLNKRVIAIGPKTAEMLETYQVSPTDIPVKFVAEQIVELFGVNLEQEKILIPTAAGARKVLPDELRKRQADVIVLPIYENIIPTGLNEISIKKGDLVVFTSSSTADHFFQSSFYNSQSIYAFCIGEITKKTVEKYLKKNIFVSKEATADSLVKCITETIQKENLSFS